MVDIFKLQIDKIQEEIRHCGPGMAPILVKANQK